MGKYSAYDVVNNWKYRLKEEEGTGMYVAGENGEIRKGFLTDLVELLVGAEIDYDEAKMVTKKVQDALVTREGKKGRGKHSGWTQTVAQDYEEVLSAYYVNIDTSDVIPLENTKKVPDFMFSSDPNGDMKKWLTETVGYSDLLYQETRRVGSSWWRKYLKDNFTV